MTAVKLPRGSILGTRVERVEDPEFLTSGAVYTEDIVDERLAGAVRLTFVRAPIAHARILSIDTSAAEQAPGCVAVFTAADLTDVPAQPPALPMFPEAMSQPLLATDTVRYVGEPVAVVVTDGRYTGEDIAELVEVDYDPLPAVVDPKRCPGRRHAAVPRLRHERRRQQGRDRRRRTRSTTARSSSPRRSSTSGSRSRRSRCAVPQRSGVPTAG